MRVPRSTRSVAADAPRVPPCPRARRQVYKVRLKKSGQTIALKIQRPNTEEVVALDLYVLRWWGGFYNELFRALGRNIDLQGVMDDFGTLLYAEIDYVAEAANARRFSELYAEDVAIANVFVPKVYSELTTRRVLTMEWVDGCRLTDSASLAAYDLDRVQLVDSLVQCSLRQIMENGFFHAGEPPGPVGPPISRSWSLTRASPHPRSPCRQPPRHSGREVVLP